MKKLSKIVCAVFALLFMGSSIYGQQAKSYLGVGYGLDYGGFGAKFEYLSIKYLGVFGGLGYNLASLGWNVGATYKILPDKRVSPNIMAFYGYNGVIKITDASEYNMTSYGITLGANVDIMLGNRGNKLSVGLFVPVRSSKFMDDYHAMKNDPSINANSLTPVTFSVGYNFVPTRN